MPVTKEGARASRHTVLLRKFVYIAHVAVTAILCRAAVPTTKKRIGKAIACAKRRIQEARAGNACRQQNGLLDRCPVVIVVG